MALRLLSRAYAPILKKALTVHTRTFQTFKIHQEKHTQMDVDQEPIEDLKELKKLLGNTNWSPKDLLPTREQIQQSPEVTSKQLHHLLRLCALTPPESAEEETKMLSDLRAQLHFVNEIQKVDTDGISPLQSIRDETEAGAKETEITLESMKEALAREEIVGEHHRRIRRRKDISLDAGNAENWDVLGQASKRVGKYFVVESKGSGESP